MYAILVQLNALTKINLGHVFCAGSKINEVPINIFGSSRKRLLYIDILSQPSIYLLIPINLYFDY